jgi:hypothetical protein
LDSALAISIDADGQHTLKSIDSMLIAEAKLAENPENISV